MTNEQMFLPPSAFVEDNYEQICVIGSGACGVVELKLLKETNTLRAIKFARNPNLEGKELHDFIREVHMLYLNRHPTIVQVFGYGIPESDTEYSPWIELEFIPGGTLSDYIDIVATQGEEASIDPTRFMIVLFGIAKALAHLHSRNIIHRDVKTTNIMLDHNIEPRLADFGFARELKPGDDISAYPHTLNYAAPELLRGEVYTSAVDVYSFGMLLFEMITLCVPYGDLGSKAIILEFISSGRKPVVDENHPLATLYNSCTELQPEMRPTMEEVCNAISEIAPTIEGFDEGTFEEYRERIEGFEATYAEDGTNETPIEESGTVENLVGLAEDGMPRAMFQVANMYLKGVGVEADVAVAANLLQAATQYDFLPALQMYKELITTGSAECPEEELKNISERIEILSNAEKEESRTSTLTYSSIDNIPAIS